MGNERKCAERIFLLRWMYNKWKAETIPQESREARKDCEKAGTEERLYSSLRKEVENRRRKKEEELAAPICVCKSNVFSRLSKQICLGIYF